MAPATAKEIQHAARVFLNGGSPDPIMRLVSDKDNRLLLAQSPGVVPRLVDMVTQGQPAIFALCSLLETGTAVQDAVAQARGGAIFNWLIKNDYNIRQNQSEVRTALTANNPTNQLVLAAAYHGVPSLVAAASTAVTSGDHGTAALVMGMLSCYSPAHSFDRNGIDFLVTSLSWRPSSDEKSFLMARDQAMFLLMRLYDAGQAPSSLIQSPLGATAHLDVLKSERSDTAAKLLAVLRLSSLLKTDKAASLDVIARGGIPALTNLVARVDAGTLVDDLRERAAFLLMTLAQHSSVACEELVQERGVAVCVLLRQLRYEPKKTAALCALRVFLRNADHAPHIARHCGIPFVFELLRFDSQQDEKMATALVQILMSLYVSDDSVANAANLRATAHCSHAVVLLNEAFRDTASSRDSDSVALAERLGALIPDLLSRLDSDTRYARTEEASLLEHLSRAPANQQFFYQRNGLKCLTTALLGDGTYREIIFRIIANIAYKNVEMSRQLLQLGVTDVMSNGYDSVGELMALRNLANNGANRYRMGSSDRITRLLSLTRGGGSMKQSHLAIGVLGNLAHLPSNRTTIVASGGVEALLTFVRRTTAPRQLETAAAALWVLLDDSIIKNVRESSAVGDIKAAMELHEAHLVQWATRLVQRLEEP